MYTLISAGLIVLAVTHLLALGVLVAAYARQPQWVRLALPVTGGVAGAWMAAELTQSPAASAAAGVISAIGLGVRAVIRRAERPAGAVMWGSYAALLTLTVPWTGLFLRRAHASTGTKAPLLLAVALTALTLPTMLITVRERWEVLIRRYWPRRLRAPMPGPLPFVSVHVPCHAEPPDVVMATLDRLAALDYPAFEVLVIDNNTTDPELWRPLERHCAALGPRFRFLHVEGITGAKAGALNWALPQTDPRATLIGLVDADYQVEPNWLCETVGYLADPAVGFVQAPHAYRDYGHSAFGRAANAEYDVFFASGMRAMDHHGAGITVGTMSLIRAAALIEAGVGASGVSPRTPSWPSGSTPLATRPTTPSASMAAV